MLKLFNTVPLVVVITNHKIISLLLHNCSFTIVMNHNGNVFSNGLRQPLCKSFNPQDENHCIKRKSPYTLRDAHLQSTHKIHYCSHVDKDEITMHVYHSREKAAHDQCCSTTNSGCYRSQWPQHQK